MRPRRALAGLVLATTTALPLAAAVAQQRGATRATLLLERRSGNPLLVHEIGAALEGALRARSEHGGFAPLAELLEPSAADRRQLEQARRAAVKARAQAQNLELGEAVASFRRAVDLRERAFHLVAGERNGVGEHAVLLTELAAAHFLGDERKQAQSALVQAFVLAPKMEFDGRKLPPQMKRFFETSRFLIDELGRGTLRVETEPPEAAVRVNGVLLGAAPVTAQDLFAGRTLVTVSLPGWARQTVGVEVAGARTRRVRVKLREVSPGMPALLRGAAAGKEVTLAALARRFDVGWLVAGGAAMREETATVSLALYDAGARRIVARVQGAVSVIGAEREAGELLSSLFTAATSHAPRRAPGAARPSGPSWVRRFYRSPYFWPVVGGVVCAAAVGTSLGVYFGTRDRGDRDRRFIAIY